jgi:hypothetical protein
VADLTVTITKTRTTHVTYLVAATERFSPTAASHLLHVARADHRTALCGFGPVVWVGDLGREENRENWCELCIEQDPDLVAQLQEQAS